MRTVRTIAALLAVLSLAIALPATVTAQSAGDQQYEDPLAGGGGGGSRGSTGAGGGGGGGGGAGNSGGGAAEATTSASGSDTQAAQASTPQAGAAQADELPRTGFEVIIPAYAGLALFLTGLVLSRLARPTA